MSIAAAQGGIPKKKSIVRGAYRQRPFTQICNEMLRDRRLSLAARGALAFIITLPPHWEFHMTWFQEEMKIGKDKAWSVIRELIQHDYCRRIAHRTEKGTISRYEYVFTDCAGEFDETSDLAKEPLPENPEVATPEPLTGSAALGKPATYKRDIEDQLETRKEKAPTDFEPREVKTAPTAPKRERKGAPTAPGAVPLTPQQFQAKLEESRKRTVIKVTSRHTSWPQWLTWLSRTDPAKRAQAEIVGEIIASSHWPTYGCRYSIPEPPTLSAKSKAMTGEGA